MKIKIFSNFVETQVSKDKLEHTVNTFTKNKKVVDIKTNIKDAKTLVITVLYED
jgi:hypothetical protein